MPQISVLNTSSLLNGHDVNFAPVKREGNVVTYRESDSTKPLNQRATVIASFTEPLKGSSVSKVRVKLIQPLWEPQFAGDTVGKIVASVQADCTFFVPSVADATMRASIVPTFQDLITKDVISEMVSNVEPLY